MLGQLEEGFRAWIALPFRSRAYHSESARLQFSFQKLVLGALRCRNLSWLINPEYPWVFIRVPYMDHTICYFDPGFWIRFLHCIMGIEAVRRFHFERVQSETWKTNPIPINRQTQLFKPYITLDKLDPSKDELTWLVPSSTNKAWPVGCVTPEKQLFGAFKPKPWVVLLPKNSWYVGAFGTVTPKPKPRIACTPETICSVGWCLRHSYINPKPWILLSWLVPSTLRFWTGPRLHSSARSRCITRRKVGKQGWGSGFGV